MTILLRPVRNTAAGGGVALPLALMALLLAAVPEARADLIASWSGNGNAKDSAGGHDGTLIGGAGFGPGLFGQAFALNGVNQYISVPSSSAWGFGGNPFTLSVWVDFNQIRQGAVGSLPNVFLADDDGPGNVSKWAFFYDGKGDLSFHVNGSQGPAFVTAPTSFVATTEEWYNFTMTRSGDVYTFYADGVSLGTATGPSTIPTPTAPLTIGESEGLGYIDGRLENVQVYNTALSAAQVAQLSAVPEPGGMSLAGLGFAAAAAWHRLRRRPTRGRHGQ